MHNRGQWLSPVLSDRRLVTSEAWEAQLSLTRHNKGLETLTQFASVADSVARVPHSKIRELAEIAMGMPDVLRLYFGESNLPTPDYLKEALDRAVRDGYTFYTENAGLPSLRAAIAGYYQHQQGVSLDPRTEIVVTASGVQAIALSIRAVLDPGDEAIVLTPAWPNASAIVGLANARSIEIAQPLEGDTYTIDFDAVERAITPRTRLLIYTSPSNPLGWVATRQQQEKLLELSRRHGLWLMADEVYDRLYYAGAELGEPVPSILQLATREDAVLVVHSFSKSYCMTGWRLGWMITRQDLARKCAQLNEFMVSCAAGFVQKAAETALLDGEEELRKMLKKLRENRDFCASRLRAMPGLTVPDPAGAFYLFPRVAGLGDSFGFCKRLLEETRVGIAPGMAFGNGGEGSVRICYASSREVLEPAMERLGNWLSSQPDPGRSRATPFAN
jgi:aspartate/methionine/tyrosine aminotransferase